MPINSLRDRQANQAKRIVGGVKSGELTKPEAKKAARDLGKAHQTIERDRVDGGGLTRKEWGKDQLLLNRTSAEIFKLKHRVSAEGEN